MTDLKEKDNVFLFNNGLSGSGKTTTLVKGYFNNDIFYDSIFTKLIKWYSGGYWADDDIKFDIKNSMFFDTAGDYLGLKNVYFYEVYDNKLEQITIKK